MNFDISTKGISADDAALPPSWSVIEFTFSNLDEDAELLVMCNHVRFVVHATANGFSSSPALREKYIFFLDVAENFEVDGYTVDDFYDWALEPLLPILFQQENYPKTGAATLHDFLYAPIIEYTLQSESDRLVIRPSEGDGEARFRFGVSQPDNTCQAWPCYLPSEIRLDEEAAYDSIPRKVTLPDGTAAFLKLMGRGEKRTLEKEIASYDKIRASSFPSSVGICRLLGLVRDESDSVFGLLLTYIDCEGQTLTCAVGPDTPEDLRRQWVLQVNETVHSMHQAGLVWGDAKPDNVLVDGKQNAWVIDFGGGYSEGWVPKDLAATVEGDVVALQKIVDYVEGSWVAEHRSSP